MFPDIDDLLTRYKDAQQERSNYEADWRMCAAYCIPRQYSRWQTDPGTTPDNNAVRRFAFDSTGVRALPKYIAILERIATPQAQRWHKLQASTPELRKIKRVREFYEALTEQLFIMRGDPAARFIVASTQTYGALGVYGTAPLYVAQREKTALSSSGFMYKACFLKDIYIEQDDNGGVTTVFREFTLTARQFRRKFPHLQGKEPKSIKMEWDTGKPSDSKKHKFLHVVTPRMDYDPKSYTVTRRPFIGCYIAVDDREYVGEEQGFRSNPYKIPRVNTESDMPYGYSPAMLALPALGSLNQMKKTVLKQGHKAVDPVLLAHDDGVLSGLDLRPGAVNPGGIDSQGRVLVKALDSGNFRVAEAVVASERDDVNDSFFVTLFQILAQNPEMTATEVVERISEKASLISPTQGFLQSEMLGPVVDRELEMLDELGLAPKPPPEVIEAGGGYEVMYTSPWAKGQYAEEVSGFMRAFDFAARAAEIMQDASPLDPFKLEVAVPEMAQRFAAPERWIGDEKYAQAKASARADQQAAMAAVQNAAGLGSAAKAVTEAQNSDARPARR